MNLTGGTLTDNADDDIFLPAAELLEETESDKIIPYAQTVTVTGALVDEDGTARFTR